MDARELVARCKLGDGQAMGLLYSMYLHKLECVSRKYVKDENEVQDIVHDSFVIIFTSIDRLKDYRKLESWMCTIVRNLSLKHLQRPMAASIERMEVAAGIEENDSMPDYSRLMTIVEQLPAGYRNVLKLSVLEGMSHKEIGELLSIEPHSSSSQLARAKVMVRRNARRWGVLALALVAAIVPLLLPEEEETTRPPVTTRQEPTGTGEAVPDTTGSRTDRLPAPVHPRHLVARHAVKPASKDSITAVIAQVTHNDTTTHKTVDTTMTKAPIAPDTRQDDRLIADEHHNNDTQETPWALSISFASGNGNNLLAMSQLPGSITSDAPHNPGDKDDHYTEQPGVHAPDTVTSMHTRHHMPLTFGITMGTSLSRRWSIETGLRYTLLRSSLTTTMTVSDNSVPPVSETRMMKTHYIGLPLKLTCMMWDKSPFSLYTSGGACADIPLASPNPVLWSVTAGAGFQYNLTPGISLYTEPSLNYYLNPGSGTPTLHTDRPLEFTIPIGLRLSW